MSSPAVQVRARAPRLAGAALEKARLRVVPRPRVQAPRVPFVILVSLVMLGGVIGLLLFNTSMQQASFAATALESQAATLSARQQSLEMELERLRDPQRVAERAQRMGMVLPGSPLFLDLRDGSVQGEVEAAAAGTRLALAPVAPALPGALDPEPLVEVVPAPEGANSPRDTERGSAAGAVAHGRNGSQEPRQSQQAHEDVSRQARG